MNNTEFFELNNTRQGLSKIKNTLKHSLKKKYKIDAEQLEEKTNDILKIHGLHIDNFDFVTNIEKVINENLNDVSIDSNSNKNEKTIEGTTRELLAPVSKLIGFLYLYQVMKNMYGKEEAKRLTGEMYDYSLGLSDSTNILKPYCWALDASKIVTLGRDFGQLQSKPSKRVSSYISALCETVHQLSNSLAGAIAIGTFFLDIAHIMIYKEKVKLNELKNNKKLRKTIENELQQFVHSVNHLSRGGSESPFTNISIFDRVKLKSLISDKNYGWYFSKEQKYFFDMFTKDITEEYIIDYILELQNIFLSFFDKGDPSSNGSPYRFPVVTVNISKKESKVKGEFILEDESFVKHITKHEIYRYNIFVSEGTKTSSCCRLLSNSEMLELGSMSNSFGGSAISLGSHRVVTINFNRIANECENIEDFYVRLNERIIDTSKILNAHRDLIKILEKKGLQQFITGGWINLNRMFSTFGVLGIYECVQTLNKRFKVKDDLDLTDDILICLNSKVDELAKQFKLPYNIEQIPAESFASRLVHTDKIIYNDKTIPYQIYANQFVPLWEDATIYKRMEIDGRFNLRYSGGGICHFTLGEKVTSRQAEKLIKYAVKVGCEHFALNAIYSKCSQNHFTFGKVINCPICKSEITDYFTRVVGFFTPVSSWNKDRREWEFPKRVVKGIE